MSQRASHLRRFLQVIRRYAILLGVTAAVSLLAGIAAAAASPVTFTSTALVLLPAVGQQTAAAASGVPGPFAATLEVIAGSNPVLSGALPDARPVMSLTGLRRDIQISSLTPHVLAVTAQGATAVDAEATANAVARSYVQYAGSASSPVGRVPAQLLEPATSAAGPAPLMRLLAGAMLGTVSGVLTGLIAVAVSRRLTPQPAA
jgi:capsular polysaccharide biosynthesis protein